MMPPRGLWADHGWFIVFAASVISIVTLVVFGRLVAFEFINHDDPYFVTLNKYVTSGLNLENIRWAFTSRELGIWHPLTWLSYQLETTVFGADSPGARHGVNLGLHLLSGIVLFLFCLRLTGARWASLFVAVLFSIHPQHVQPVAWIAERKEVLAAFFFLVSLYFYATYRACQNRKSIYMVSFLAFGLALLCKPSAAPLPVILVLIDIFYHGTENKTHLTISIPQKISGGILVELLRDKIPFFLLSTLLSGITIYIKKTGGWAGWEEVLPLGRRLLLMPIGMLHYLQKLVVPWPNQFWIVPPDGMPYLEFIFSSAVLVVLGLLVWRLRDRCAELLFGALWFVIMWLPVSGIVLVGKHYVADRYTYLPYIGCFFGLVFLTRALCKPNISVLRMAFFFGVVIVSLSAALAYRQTGYWRDSITFFQREIELNPFNSTAPLRLGQALIEKRKYEPALVHLQTAIELDENELLAYSFKADALQGLGRVNEAKAAYREEIARGSPRVNPFVMLGRLLIDEGAATDAIQVMEEGLTRFPSDAHLLAHLAHTYGFTLDQPEQALSYYQRVLVEEPANSAALHGIGVLYLRSGEIDKGVSMLTRLLEIDPDNEAVRKIIEEYGI